MPLAPEERLKFFVYIVESPSALDLYNGRHEGTMLRQSLQLSQISAIDHLAVTKEAFKAALLIGLPEAMKLHSALIPIIHISAHGDDNGLQLADGSRIDWHELKVLLQPINKALNGFLLVCMSCCKGYFGVRMAMEIHDEDAPFFALIGNHDSPTWSETSIGFCTLYHLVNKGETVMDAVKCMNAAAGVTSFAGEKAEDTKKNYIEYCSQKQLAEAQATLTAASESAQISPPLAKFTTDITPQTNVVTHTPECLSTEKPSS